MCSIAYGSTYLLQLEIGRGDKFCFGHGAENVLIRIIFATERYRAGILGGIFAASLHRDRSRICGNMVRGTFTCWHTIYREPPCILILARALNPHERLNLMT